MLNPRAKLAGVLGIRSGLRGRMTRLLAAVGVASLSPEITFAARRGTRRDRAQDTTEETAKESSSDGAGKTRNDKGAGRNEESAAATEDTSTSDKSAKSRKEIRNEEQAARDQTQGQNETDTVRRGDSQRRKTDSDSSAGDDSSDDGSGHEGRHRVRRFEQQADDPANAQAAERIPDATSVTTAHPDVLIERPPEGSIYDLSAYGTDEVVASLGRNGGFAFARSGEVIAVTGPDGASIARSGDVIAETRGTVPYEPPDDGGNNNPDFVS